MTKRFILAALAAFSIAAAEAAQYSKLAIVTTAKHAGKWELVKSWIEQAGLTDEWQAASYFSDDYPLFAQITNQVVASGVATKAEVDAFLAAARDTAPDALLAGMYGRDMANDAGRRRWHGERIAQFIVTNEMMRIACVYVYADGFIFTNAAQRAARPDPEEAAKRREEAERKAEEARRAWEKANLPPELAALREAQRQAMKTNEVTIIVEGN